MTVADPGSSSPILGFLTHYHFHSTSRFLRCVLPNILPLSGGVDFVVLNLFLMFVVLLIGCCPLAVMFVVLYYLAPVDSCCFVIVAAHIFYRTD
jgi:hypothetical protein